MRYSFLSLFFNKAYEFIDYIGTDTFISISILLWALFIWNIIKKGTRI